MLGSQLNHSHIECLTILGLGQEITYEFKVAAENRAGRGPWSDPSAPVTPKEIIGEFI